MALEPSLPGSARRWRPLVVLLAGVGSVLVAAALYHGTLFAPGIDSSHLIYWSQQVSYAPQLMGEGSLGRHIAEPSMTSLVGRLLAEVRRDAIRVFTLLPALLLGLWMKLTTSSVASAQRFSLLVGLFSGVAFSSFVALTLRERLGGLTWALLATFLLFAMNPGILDYTISPSWHGVALACLVGSMFLARDTWRTWRLAPARRAALIVCLVAFAYSVYVLPLILIGAWSVCDLVAARRERATARSLVMWGLVALLLLPALAVTAYSPASTAHWSQEWLNSWSLKGAIAVGVGLVQVTAGTLFAYLLLRRSDWLRFLPFHIFTIFLFVLLVLPLSSGDESVGATAAHLGVYLLPGAILATVTVGSYYKAVRLLAGVGVALALVTLIRPGVPYRLLNGEAYQSPQQAAWGRAAAAALKSSAGNRTLIFANRPLAWLALARIPQTSTDPVLSGIDFLESLTASGGKQTRPLGPYFRQSQVTEFVLVSRKGLLDEVIPLAKRSFRVRRIYPVPDEQPPKGNVYLFELVQKNEQQPVADSASASREFLNGD